MVGKDNDCNQPPPNRGHKKATASDTSHSLLKRAQAMDEEAWSTLVEVYSPLINYWVRLKGISKQHDIENTRQDVFLNLARYLHSFHRNSNKGAFRKWLRTITHNLAFTAHRHNKDIVLGGNAGADMFNNLACGQVSIFDSVSSVHVAESSILYRSIMKWIESSFTDVQIGIFSGLVIHGRKPKDLAEDLGVSLYTVYHTKSRVLKKVREEFEQFV